MEKGLQLSKIWKLIIFASFSLSIFSLSISFNLINIDQINLLSKDDTKSIVDNSITYNSSSDINIKNLIDSNATISYTKKTQILSNRFTKKISITNNDKVNYHNVIIHDMIGNTFFLKDYLYNKTITYVECNDEYTNCAIYTQFMLENNNKYPTCFEAEIENFGPFNIKKNPSKYFYENQTDCLDYDNIPS